MKRILLPHSAIVKSPGLLPMLYTVRELSEAIGVVDRTLRDWLADGAPHFYDATGHIWIEGRDFADWILSMRKPKRDRRLVDDEADCLRCKEVVELVNPTATAVRGNLIVYEGKCPKCQLLLMVVDVCQINISTGINEKRQRGVDSFVQVDELFTITNQRIGKANLALWRDQAMACLLFLSGARASAAATLPIKAVHLNVVHPCIEQKPELGVRTKDGKAAITYLHMIPDLLDFIRGWDEFVRANFPEDHLWYAPIHQEWGEQSTRVLVPGKNRSTALGKRLRIISAMSHLSYKSPHKYRHGYAFYGLERCQTMEQYHALSRNMMHNNISITDQVCVHLEVQERGRILSCIYSNPIMKPDGELSQFIFNLGKEDIQEALRLIATRLVSL